MRILFKITLATVALIATSASGVGQAKAEPSILPPNNHAVDGQLTLDVKADQNGAKITWSTLISDQDVRLTRDGIELTSSTGSGTYTDTSVNSGDEPSYSVEVVSNASKAEILESGFIGSKSELESSLPLAQSIDILTAQVGIPFPLTSNFFGAPANATTTPINNTKIRYQTFIHDTHVLAPYGCITLSETLGGGTYFFAGDNRAFDPTPGSSRTRFDVTADWLNSGNLTWSKSVGSSHKLLLTLFGLQEVAVDRASSASMTVDVVSESSNQSVFHMHQDVENPFCLPGIANGIYVDYDFVLSKNGTYSVSGVALNAPNHELYLQNDSSNIWHTIFNRTGDMACLIPNPFSSCTPYHAHKGVI
ncbi:MAG: hypothetical protein RL196_168 [Actinomycetota bacterium]|jgi:hypothetical protein